MSSIRPFSAVTALTWRRCRSGLAGDERARFVRGEGGEDADRDVEGDGRADRARVEHLGAEVGQLLGLVVADLGDDAGVGDLARVGGEDAGHVGPDLDLVGVERGAEEGGAVVGAAAAERGRRAVRGAADEAGDDDGLAGVEMGADDRPGRVRVRSRSGRALP